MGSEYEQIGWLKVSASMLHRFLALDTYLDADEAHDHGYEPVYRRVTSNMTADETFLWALEQTKASPKTMRIAREIVTGRRAADSR